jgi:hypothetical protein
MALGLAGLGPVILERLRIASGLSTTGSGRKRRASGARSEAQPSGVLEEMRTEPIESRQ